MVRFGNHGISISFADGAATFPTNSGISTKTQWPLGCPGTVTSGVGRVRRTTQERQCRRSYLTSWSSPVTQTNCCGRPRGARRDPIAVAHPFRGEARDVGTTHLAKL